MFLSFYYPKRFCLSNAIAYALIFASKLNKKTKQPLLITDIQSNSSPC